MNRLYAFFIVCAILFWGVFAYRLLDKMPDRRKNGSTETQVALPSMDDLSRWITPQKAPPQGLRDPFRLPASYRPSAPHTSAKAIVAEEQPAKPQVPKPAVTLDAILPGDKPVVILRYKGQSAVMCVGQELWGVTVTQITAQAVTLSYVGGTFVLTR